MAAAALALLLASICISLAFDIVDLGRYLAGERGSLIPAEAAEPG